jgi:hypothetical protein
MTEQNFNINPYYDDYSEEKGFYQILFKPSQPVQARELTQLQTILKTQNKKLLEHLFENGSMVLPGQIAVDLKYSYVKIEPQYLSADVNINNFKNKVVTGRTTGAKALVIEVSTLINSDPKTLFIKYIDGGTNGLSSVFQNGEILDTNDTIPISCTTFSNDSTGFGSSVSIQEGWYFINGLLAKVNSQTLILDKYSNTPSYKCGVNSITTIVEAGDDSSLLDNAQGSPNYAAPGADRYKIQLVLSKRSLDSIDDENFIELLRLENGDILRKIDSPAYAYLEKEMAKRTFEESGNYTVRTFPVDVREHLLNGTNRGKYTALQGGLESKIALGVEPAIAYVNGFRIETIATTFVDVNKARTTRLQNNGSVSASLGQYTFITNAYNFPDLSSFPLVDLQDTATVTRGTASGTKIGSARIRGIELETGTGGNNAAIYRLYLFDIKMNITKNFSDVKQVYLSGSPAFTTDIKLNSLNQAEITDGSKGISIFRFPQAPIEKVRASDLSVDTFYDVKRVFTGTTTSRVISFNAGVNEVFNSFNTKDWVLTITSGTNTGNFVDLNSKVSLSGSPIGKIATITLTSAIPADASVRLVAPITKQISQEKTKTLQTGSVAFTAATSTMSLGRADVYRIVGIYDSSNISINAVNTDLNITDRYSLDTGQRDSHYDIGNVSLKPNQSAPSGRILIEFEYFSHGSGDYFSVDSYKNQIEYVNIPSYVSSTGDNYSLRDCLDFRPRKDNTGTNFTGTGSSLIESVRPNSNIIADYFYYLNRIDKLAVNDKGNFFIIEGIPDVNPKPPADLTNAMSLYELAIRAFTFTTQDVITNLVDNKRYTMRDIGKLEKRIDNLEYYTTLSLLEKETASLQIIDATTGLDRFKNGFVVDPFSDHGVGDTLNGDYRCAIDKTRGELRPPFNEDNFGLEFIGEKSSNFKKTGDLITLPYVSTNFIKQPYASRSENVNPYAIFTFIGSIQLTPETDDWKDTEQQPDLNVNLPDNVDVISQIAASAGFTGTQWNSWENQWAGAPIQTSQTTTTQKVSGNNVNPAGNRWPLRIDTTTSVTFAQQVGQSRTGVSTTITPRTVQTSLGDRVVSVDLIPYMRSRDIQFSVVRMKPNTRIYAFFDEVPVSAFCKPLTGSNGNPMITDNNGSFTGIFTIPNTPTTRFRTGDRVFKLTDSNINLDDNTTKAEVTYTARGLLQTQQETILSTRVAQVDRTQVSDSRTITNTSTSTNTQTGAYYDPLAQTFLNDQSGGCFVTKIDLFFKSKSTNIPITLQLRSAVNGYPGPYIFPFGEITLNPSKVNISEDASVATTFTFPSPVYLLQNTEYCFVVLSDSIDYQMYIGRIGENELGSQRLISQQPYTGVMFKSQNASTWTADQTSDIKFTIYKAEFNTNVQSIVSFQNKELTTVKLNKNSLETTNGSNKIVVYHKNHGFTENSNVSISNVASGTYNGISSSEFVGNFNVTEVDLDTYAINVISNATSSGKTGGEGIIISRNIQMDVMNPTIQQTILPNTNVVWACKTTSGKHPHGNQIPYIKDTNFSLCGTNENTEFYSTRLIASTKNELDSLAGVKSFEIQGIFASDNKNISPVVDTQRASVITVANLLDSPTNSNVHNYISETVGLGGSAKAKYITKRITLNNPAIALKVYMGVSKWNENNVDVYYKTKTSDDTTLFENKSWTLINPLNGNLSTNDSLNFQEYQYLVDNLEPFITVALKVVLRSTDSTKIPKLGDLRLVALGT